jgi:hypothetical protein
VYLGIKKTEPAQKVKNRKERKGFFNIFKQHKA